MKFLLKYLKPFFGIMTVGIIIKVLGTVVELFIPLILTHILDNVVITERISEIIFWV